MPIGACLGQSSPSRAPGRVVVFTGACDASGSVELSSSRFLVADDEDNTLRVYDADRGGAPLQADDVSTGIALEPKAKKAKKKKKAPKKPKVREADLEAATRVGDVALWMSSHGRSKSGKRQEDRLRYFATRIPAAEEPIEVIGQVYRGLLDDLVAAPQLAPFDLAAAAERSPQEPGGLNIEGMTAAPEGHVWIGFRNPVPQGRALLVPILNPVGLSTATPARLGDPVQLDLGGRGVRALSWWRGQYLVLGGGVTRGRDARLFTWTSSEARAHELPIELDDFNGEAMFSPEDRDEVLVLSDDGEVEIDGTRCKDLADPEAKRFRGVWVKVTSGRAVERPRPPAPPG